VPTLIASFAAFEYPLPGWSELILRYAIGSIAILWIVQRVARVPKVLGSISRGPEAGTDERCFCTT